MDIQQLTPASEQASLIAAEIADLVNEYKLAEASELVNETLEQKGFKVVSDVMEYYATTILMYYSIEAHVDLGLQIPGTAICGDMPEDELSGAKLAAAKLIQNYLWHMSQQDVVRARSEFGELLFACIDKEGDERADHLKTLNIIIRDMVRSMIAMLYRAPAGIQPQMLARAAAYHRYLAFITRAALKSGKWCDHCKPQAEAILQFERKPNEDTTKTDFMAAPGKTTIEDEEDD